MKKAPPFKKAAPMKAGASKTTFTWKKPAAGKTTVKPQKGECGCKNAAMTSQHVQQLQAIEDAREQEEN
ncbi:hypothetical protein EWM64_g3215 [Hericium alpestre]|uniref:Uncharacterized protein n=1 Tax=Hericium alpestre TaxID=135208 RepID=A0A4Z0A540_9AGAM|nr:hypothetical protein EWM64_g3215 [Hericium alpestre]